MSLAPYVSSACARAQRTRKISISAGGIGVIHFPSVHLTCDGQSVGGFVRHVSSRSIRTATIGRQAFPPPGSSIGRQSAKGASPMISISASLPTSPPPDLRRWGGRMRIPVSRFAFQTQSISRRHAPSRFIATVKY